MKIPENNLHTVITMISYILTALILVLSYKSHKLILIINCEKL